MKDRIAHIMRAKNLKASDFASLLGIQPSAVSHILAGRNKPSLEIVRKIKETFPEYNLDWIIFGTGPVTTSEPFRELPQSPSNPTLFEVANAPSVPSSAPPDDPDSLDHPDSFSVGSSSVDPSELLAPGSSLSTFPSGIRAIVVFYEDGTFESFQPR